MSWGNKLLVAFIAFGALIGTLVYKCMHQNFELVSKDYYADELKYQDRIDGANNAGKLSAVQVSTTGTELAIQLPKELNGQVLKGEAWFYCATNAADDRRIPLTVDDKGIMLVDKSKLAKASYVLKLNWENTSEKFYNEQAVSLR
ncbi:FixH family protein [Panacibacter sp. DH6]|uniref:FixH family protein n=1 Tax=Panacibacter microcysteis TaxID=2793269 RepID=A0A931GZA5_9BACT|nr:FixH family protein [Panacibacter microcysteis]MBG9378120.1 FixH family protein [Panacibacter microcysteis]